MIHQPQQRHRPVVYSHTAHANITRCSIKRCLFSVCIVTFFSPFSFFSRSVSVCVLRAAALTLFRLDGNAVFVSQMLIYFDFV